MDAKRAMNVLAGFTADQWGLVTTAQATDAGVGSTTLARLANAGLIDHIRRGVYAVAGAPEDEHRSARAAWLQLNPSIPAWKRPVLDPDGGVFSHGTAAHLHDLGDLLIGAFQFTVPRRRTSAQSDIMFRHLPLAGHDVVKADGLPVTSVERTIADMLADHIDGGHMGDIIHQAIQRKQVDIASLAHRVGPYARRYGVTGKNGRALLHSLLEQSDKTLSDIDGVGDRDLGQLLQILKHLEKIESSSQHGQVTSDLVKVALSTSKTMKNIQELLRNLMTEPSIQKALSQMQAARGGLRSVRVHYEVDPE